MNSSSSQSNRLNVRVFLERVQVLDSHDPLWCGPEEIRFLCRVSTGKDARRTQSTRLPTTGVYQMEAGEQAIERYIFDGDMNLGESLEIEICGVEEDWLSADDPLTRYHRTLAGAPETWAKSYGPEDETEDPESLADWKLWYRVEVEIIGEKAADTLSGPLRRMALFRRERGNASGEELTQIWQRALAHKQQMRRPNPREDDPGGPAPSGGLRASIDVAEGVSLQLLEAQDPKTVKSFGNVGRFVRIAAGGPFRDAQLKVGLTPAEANQVNPASLRLFRYDELRKRFQLVNRSGLGNDGSYVWGRINKAGLYGVFGLPRDQASLIALQVFKLARPLGKLYQEIAGDDFPFLDPICNVILCPDLQEFPKLKGLLEDPDELDRLGFGDLVGDPYLLEGDSFGDPPRDKKGRPIGARRIKERPGETLPVGRSDFRLPGLRFGVGPCDRCFEHANLDPPEMDIPSELGGYGIQISCGCEKWQSVGPTNLAGRVKSLAYNPIDGSIVYAGASEGGVFKSTDGGRSWFPTMEGEASLSIGAVAVAQTSPDIVYAGTGEYGGGESAYSGVGIYRSTHAGGDWDLMPPVASNRISRIAVHPINPNLVYVAGNRGIHRWDGVRWTDITDRDTSDIVLDPDNPRRLYAGTEISGILVTSNADDPVPIWMALNSGLSLPAHQPKFIKLAISPSNPRVLYAQVNHEVLELRDGVFRWKLEGATTYRLEGSIWRDKGLHGGGTQGSYCSFVRVHPTDENKIFVGGVTFEWSPDGGDTWYPVDSNHVDAHDLVFDPSNPDRTLVSNDGGIWRHTQTATETAFTYADSNRGLVTILFYDVGVSQTGYFTIGGSTQDQGVLVAHASTNYGGLGGNEGGIFEVDPNNSEIIYWDPGDAFLSCTNPGSLGGARDATNGIERLLDGDGHLVVPDVQSLAIQPGNSNVLICAVAGPHNTTRIYRSLDGAAPAPEVGWVSVLEDAGSNVNRIAFAPSDRTWVYAITDAGLVYRSTDTGGTWQQVSNETLGSGSLRGLAVDWDDELTLYVTYGNPASGRAFASTDGGVNWRSISGVRSGSRLPDIYTNSIVVHQGKPETLYVCTDVGVFRTQDGGDWWYPFDEGLPNAVATDMDYQPHAQTLYVSTIGRGMYKRLL